MASFNQTVDETPKESCIMSMQNTSKHSLISAYFDRLSPYEWTHIGTLTVRHKWTKFNLEEAFQGWIRRLENDNQMRVNYVYNIEETEFGRPHVHFLLGNISGVLTVRRIRDLWGRGHSEVQLYNPAEGGLFYVLKEMPHSEFRDHNIKGLRRRKQS
jgi:hypothetical protein